jgi:hypothetical protein
MLKNTIIDIRLCSYKRYGNAVNQNNMHKRLPIVYILGNQWFSNLLADFNRYRKRETV